MFVPELTVDTSVKTTEDVNCRIAATLEERASAFRLIYDSYLRAGLGEPNRYHLRVTPYHLLPTTEVFIATCQEETIFTMSLVIDGELGLPMESVYGPEVEQRREQGILLGEISCLADRQSHFRGFFPVFLRLSRLLGQYAWRQGVDQLVAAVHPRHSRFYRRFLNFRTIGVERVYPTVRNNPAVALGLDLANLEQNDPVTHDRFFGQWLPEENTQPKPIRGAEIEFFRVMVDPTFRLAPVGDAEDFRQGHQLEPVLIGA